jgi:hypothetical protein
MDWLGDDDGDGAGASPYFLEISRIARSISSRAGGAGVEGGSVGVLDTLVSPLTAFRFFFLFLDFFVCADDDDVGLVATIDPSVGSTFSSSSEPSLSFSF